MIGNNSFILKALIPSLKKAMETHDLDKIINGFLSTFEDKKLEDEASVVVTISSGADEKVYVAVVAFDEDNIPVRVIAKMHIVDFVTSILEQVSKN